jgi:hypothetical protein
MFERHIGIVSRVNDKRGGLDPLWHVTNVDVLVAFEARRGVGAWPRILQRFPRKLARPRKVCRPGVGYLWLHGSAIHTDPRPSDPTTRESVKT